MSGVSKTIHAAELRRFRPYPAYKDSGVEWLGQTPAHWENAKMWRISSAVSGGTPSKEEPGYWDGDIPWVSPKDMKRRVIDSSEDTITERALIDSGIKLIAPPAVLIVVRGMILAHSFPVAITTVPVTINQDMKALRFRQDIDPVFMTWTFEGIGEGLLAAVVEEAAHGTRAIRMDQWRSVTVPIPPEAEQRAIVAFLGRETARLDSLVAKKGRLLELLYEKRAALITRAVTKGLDPNVPMKDSGVEWLGKTPAHWQLMIIRDIAADIQTGPFGSQLHADEYRSGGYPVINPANLRDGQLIPDPDCTVDDATATRLAPHRLREGDILFARRGELGRCGLVTKREEGWVCGTGCLRLRLRNGVANPRFLVRLLSTAGVAEWLELQSVGATMQNLNSSIIGRIPVLIPRMTEQGAITEFLDYETGKLDALIAKVCEAIDRLKDLRTALIFAAVTGRADVRKEAT